MEFNLQYLFQYVQNRNILFFFVDTSCDSQIIYESSKIKDPNSLANTEEMHNTHSITPYRNCHERAITDSIGC